MLSPFRYMKEVIHHVTCLCEASHKLSYVESYIMRRNRLKHLTFL